MINIKSYVRFVLIIIIAHTLSYLIAGGIAYQLITKEFWEGSNSLLSVYLRTPGNSELWNYAMIWQIPGQILRSLIFGLVLLPLFDSIKEWKFLKRFLFFSSLFFVFTHFSSAVPSPANIEGLIYMKPEFIKLGFLKMQPEMILYSIILGLIVSKYLYKKSLLLNNICAGLRLTRRISHFWQTFDINDSL